MYRTADRPRVAQRSTTGPPPTAPARVVADLLPPALGTLSPLSVPPLGGLPRVWLIDVSAHARSAQAAAGHTLSPAERDRAAAFMHREDREAYLASHVALRRLLSAYTGVHPQSLDLIRDPCPLCSGPHGRPALKGGAGPYFSLSHTRGAGLVAVSATPVGVDGEAVSEIHVTDELRVLLHPREQNELARTPHAVLDTAFARAWTRKEAYLKGLGTGLGRSSVLDYVGTGLIPASPDPLWRVLDLALPPSFAGAVAWRATELTGAD